jgi:hypothetical protein
VALLIAKMLKSMNKLSSGHLIVAKHEDFVSSYMGTIE